MPRIVKDIYQVLLSRAGLPSTPADVDSDLISFFNMSVLAVILHWMRNDESGPRRVVLSARQIAIEAESDREAGLYLSRFFSSRTGFEINEFQCNTLDSLWCIFAT